MSYYLENSFSKRIKTIIIIILQWIILSFRRLSAYVYSFGGSDILAYKAFPHFLAIRSKLSSFKAILLSN